MATSSSLSFGALLRQHRLRAGLTQKALAGRAGVSVRGLQQLEHGARTAPRAETVRLLADALELDDEARDALIAAARPELGEPVPSPPLVSTVPAPPTPLVGRERELAAACTLLRPPGDAAGTRLLTLTGPGGVGKTRLALAIAGDLARHYGDGVVFVDFAPLGEAALVTSTIAYAAGLAVEAGPDPAAQLLVALQSRHLLLLLDNCEHLLDGVAGLTSRLLAGCPSLQVLATSREPMRMRAEHEFRVPPLAVAGGDEETPSAAVVLFAQRAHAVQPLFTLDEASRPVVTEICRRLDGLPLAIELAASWVRVLPPAALLERLTQRVLDVPGGLRDLPARQQTMREAIAWSYALLDEAEQALFGELAVFVGGFSLAGAAAICTLDELATLERIGSLVVKSLVRFAGDPDGEPRYAMLETIREFGLERLAASGQEAEVRSRHADWCLAFAERAGPQVKGPDAAFWLDALERELANVRAALIWLQDQRDGARLARLAGALWRFWHEHAHYSEGRHWLAAALELGEEAPAPDRLRLLSGSGVLAWYQADEAFSRQMQERALALAREIGDRAAEAFELGNLAVHAAESGDFALATARYEASLAAAREVGDPGPVVLALHNLAHQDWEHGQAALALPRLEEALAVAREHRLRWALPFILVALGMTATDLGDPARAVACFRESIELAQVRGNLGDVIDGMEGLARLAAVTGQAEPATRLFGATAALRETLGAPMAPSDLSIFEPVLNGLRETLGEDGFVAAWAAGRQLSREEAVAAALAIDASEADPAAPDGARPPTPHDLSQRELEVLRLIAAGKSNREIGDLLFISTATAARHVANIYAKLGLDSRAAATAFAHRHDLV
jgi:non-specific serine/threonine protein kinase